MKGWILVTLATAMLAVSPGTLPAQESGISVGARAPAVTVNDLDGKPVDLGQYIGKRPVFVEFWATWCEQ
jgi:thiol-disulfide isomerase/thioredoxin